MLDLDNLRIIRREEPEHRRFSFVGLRVSPIDKKQEFWLPQGFQGFPTDDYEKTVGLFFSLFRVMQSFTQANALREQRDGKRDPLSISDTGIEFSEQTETPILTFSKLNVINAIVDSFDDLVLSAVVSKPALRPSESYEEVHRHLHEAVFLDDDRIYFERLPAVRPEVILGATQLVGMFCFVYVEIAQQLGAMQRVSNEARDHAHAFKEEHLADTDGLFVEHNYKITLDTLKEILERIDKTTPYKDDDFWQLFNALEIFLYGDIAESADEDGIVWGWSDFHPIWEEMGHAFAKEYIDTHLRSQRIVFAHTPSYANTSIAGQRVFSDLAHENPFRIEVGEQRRTLFPDLITAPRRATDELRKRFEKLLLISRGPVLDGYYRSVVLRPGEERAAIKWLALARRRMTKASWHEIKGPKYQVTYRNVPAKRFDRIIDDMFARYAAQTDGPRPVFIMDFKYLHPTEYCGAMLSTKISADIVKQHVYELAYQCYDEEFGTGKTEIVSQFLVPLYVEGVHPLTLRNENMPPEMAERVLHDDFVETGIQLVAIPFQAAADAYTRVTSDLRR